MNRRYIYWIPTERYMRNRDDYYVGRTELNERGIARGYTHHDYMCNNKAEFDQVREDKALTNSYRNTVSILKQNFKVRQIPSTDERIGMLDKANFIYFL